VEQKSHTHPLFRKKWSKNLIHIHFLEKSGAKISSKIDIKYSKIKNDFFAPLQLFQIAPIKVKQSLVDFCSTFF